MLSIRAEATRAIFDKPTAVQAEHFHMKASNLFDGNFHREYVAVHIRWGDKIIKESKKVEAPRYVEAAEALAAEIGVNTVLIVTAEADAVDAVRQEIQGNYSTSNLTYIFPNYYSAYDEALDYISDIMLLTSGRGAIVTYSSNMGRLVYYLSHQSILRQEFDIVSMDRQHFTVNTL